MSCCILARAFSNSSLQHKLSRIGRQAKSGSQHSHKEFQVYFEVLRYPSTATLLCPRLKPGPVAMQVFDGIWMFAGPCRILDFFSSDVQQASTVSFVIQDSSWYPETVLEKIHTLPFDRKVYFSCLSTESADACFCQRISFLLSILNVHFMEQVSALYLRHFPQQLRNWDSSSSLSSARGSGLYIAFNRKFR